MIMNPTKLAIQLDKITPKELEELHICFTGLNPDIDVWIDTPTSHKYYVFVEPANWACMNKSHHQQQVKPSTFIKHFWPDKTKDAVFIL